MKNLLRLSFALLAVFCLCACNIRTQPVSETLPSSTSSVVVQASSTISEPVTKSESVSVSTPEPTHPSPPAQEPFIITPTGPKVAPDPENWNLHLVNLAHPLPDEYAPPLAQLSSGHYYDARAAEALEAMLEEAAEAGVTIWVTSAYRSMAYQQEIYNQEIQYYINRGYGEAQAVTSASSLVAVPGTSEHQLGLAADLITPDHRELLESFENTDGFAWLDKHAASFGFILRYPKDKVEITGISYEPWHYRYVGTEHASEIKHLDMCLEEYLEYLEVH